MGRCAKQTLMDIASDTDKKLNKEVGVSVTPVTVEPISVLNEIEFIIPVNYVESVNKLNTGVVRYTSTKDPKTGRMYNKPVPGVMLRPEARAAMHNYFTQLERYIPKYMIPKTDWKNVDITYGFYIGSKTFRRRDNDNMLKIFQDCMSHHLGFDDSQIVTVHTYKRCLNNKTRTTNQEYIYIKLKNASKTDSELIVHEEDIKSRIGFKWS